MCLKNHTNLNIKHGNNKFFNFPGGELLDSMVGPVYTHIYKNKIMKLITNHVDHAHC